MRPSPTSFLGFLAVLLSSTVLALVLDAIALDSLVARHAHADGIRTFALDGSGTQTLAADTLTVTLAGALVDEVTFDAVLTVVGSADLTQTSSGLGVAGGSNPLNDGESLRFSLALSDVVGGEVFLDGFAGVELKFFSSDGEEAVFSLDADLATAGDNFLTATTDGGGNIDLLAHLPSAFSLFGQDNGGSASFRVDSIDARFRGIRAVPEASGVWLLGAGLACVAVARRRRIAAA